jgi:hypothetical protein
MIIKRIAFALIFLHCAVSKSQSLRGLSVLNDSHVWVSGNNGYIGRLNSDTLDACNVPADYKSKDFRDIHAFSASHAIAMSVGDSGVLIKTSDFGQSWFEVFRENEPGVFFDVIEFDKLGALGLLMGDPLPINPNFLYFRVSLDSGNHWIELSNGKWNRISPKLNALFAASGSSVRILNFDHNPKKGLINLKLVIGGGGDMGASIRMAYVVWSSNGDLISEKITEIPLPLPSDKGWGVYGMSQVWNNQIVLGGGHWKYPNGQPNSVDSGFDAKENNYDGLYLLKFSDATMSLRPLKLYNYVSGTDFLKDQEIIAVGPNGVAAINLPRKRSQADAILSWNLNLLGITEYITNEFRSNSIPFRALNALSVSENFVWIIGVAPKPLLLRIPKLVFERN